MAEPRQGIGGTDGDRGELTSGTGGELTSGTDGERAALTSGTGGPAVSDDDSFLRLAAHIPVSDPDRSGQRLGHFLLQRRLGRGGMGAVYAAQDVRLGRRVAVKVLRPRAVGEADPRRMLREARAAAAVEHPSIVTVFDVGVEGDALYIAMELVEGETLRERLRRGPLPRREAARLVQRVAEAVGRAHAAGIVHRDLKPENVMLTPEGDLKLLDFGLAGATEERAEPGAPPEPSGAGDGSRGATAGPALGTATRLAGTPGYMAPEQRRGERVTPATDVWALGVVLHELVTGERPEREQARRPALGRALGGVVRRCLEEHPAARPPTGAALAAELGRALRGERRVARALLLGGLAGAGVGAAWLGFAPRSPAPGVAPARSEPAPALGAAASRPTASGAPGVAAAVAEGAPQAAGASAGAPLLTPPTAMALPSTAPARPAAARSSARPAPPAPPAIDPLARQR